MSCDAFLSPALCTQQQYFSVAFTFCRLALGTFFPFFLVFSDLQDFNLFIGYTEHFDNSFILENTIVFGQVPNIHFFVKLMGSQ